MLRILLSIRYILYVHVYMFLSIQSTDVVYVCMCLHMPISSNKTSEKKIEIDNTA